MIDLRPVAVGAGIDPAGWPPNLLAPADRERLARYEAALSFYRGEQWLGRPRRGEPRLTFNYARALLRKAAAYVFPAPATFTVPAASPGDPSAGGGDGRAEELANRVERALADLVAELDLARLDVELCVDAAVLGDAALKVTWDAAAGRPAVAPVDPATLVVAAAADDPRRLLRVTQVYGLTGGGIAAPGRGSRWRGRRCATGRTPTAGSPTCWWRTTRARTRSGARATWSTSTTSAAN